MTSERTHSDAPYSVAIVGTGFAGLGMAIRLKQAGNDDFVVFEKAGEVGGTWRENTYPGAACDVPSHMYSFSFAPNPSWSRSFAPQAEILDYLRGCADTYGIRRHLRFHAEIDHIEYDDATALWTIRTADGGAVTARAVVAGIGPLHVPAIPEIPGMESFEGKVMHSAEWDHSYDLTGKKVAVIGTGASAIQIVPAIAEQVDTLHLFQRTAPWVLPKMDRAYSGVEKLAFKYVPGMQKLTRNRIYWLQEARILGMAIDPRLMKGAEALAKAFIRTQIDDPELRKTVTPDFAMGCKRILLSNTYYAALNRDDVNVITSGIAEVRPNAVVTKDGVVHEVDAIIYGTGFQVGDLGPLNVTGSGGVKLRDFWEHGKEAYLGMTVPGFPNLFYLVGPNTGLGHNSIVFMAEAQIDFILKAMKKAERAGGRVEVRPEAYERFNDEVQGKLAGTVWNAGCTSWYLDPDGKNRTLWPGFSFTYWLATRRFKEDDFVVGSSEYVERVA